MDDEPCMKLFLVPPLAYLRMCLVPCERIPLHNPGLSPTGVLTVNGGVGIIGMEDNLTHLVKMGYVLERDEKLTPQEKVESEALTALVVEKLFKCQLYDLWCELENYETFTKASYSQPASLPLKWWLDKERKKNMLQYLALSGYNDADKKCAIVKKVARDIYEALSIRLGSEHFFFGDHPTMLDCIIFGFLQTQACKDIPKSHIQEFLFSHKNLVDFCNRITENWYMSTEAEEIGLLRNNLDYKPLITYTKKKEEKGLHEQEKSSGYIILAGLAAIFVYTALYQNSGR